mmetsp:Transcript_82023/g.227439  ORF Transcript_82023/g.227439 Transcript_82023/m.227439 type:complete len:1025 (+) Transcript_82023:106-3180(+)|eukprot:CAMPEP_0179114508 /NCGR_PEP_ID=MMETSP0796-20121207/53622_1 /TAXON_ID=73915 /ORGANISM="Pyrodinium bahamense, Strain pbaha01" /LENGTH=1024 /DNA_ID=CAMNT_0020812733 /DNA_START=66 /DNA_END=3140 /DNA_ORIENTATION=+
MAIVPLPVLLLAMAALTVAAERSVCAAEAPRNAGDAVVLVQRSVRTRGAAGWSNRFLERANSFKVGDALEFKVSNSTWLNCTVVGEEDRVDSYVIHVPALPQGHQQVTGVDARSLRDPRQEEARRSARSQAERRATEEARIRDEQEEIQFEDHEDVLLAGSGSAVGKWFPARIQKPGKLPGTYDVLYKGKRIPSVKTTILRKAHEMHYDACEPVDIVGAGGVVRRGKVLGPGTERGFVSVRHPEHAPGSEVLEVPLFMLRKVSQVVNTSNAIVAAAGTEKKPVYEVGKAMWAQLEEGRGAKPWVPCVIVGAGDEPDTYNVRITTTIPAYDLCDVPAKQLREMEDSRRRREGEQARVAAEVEEKRRAAEEQAQQEERSRLREEEAAQVRLRQQAVSQILSVAEYHQGQEVLFHLQGARWVNCTVVSLVDKPHTYNIFVPSFPEGLQSVNGVHAQFLLSRNEAKRRQAEALEAKRRAAEEEKAKAEYAHTFYPGDRVQVQIANNTWAYAIIKNNASTPAWYTAYVRGEMVTIHKSSIRRDWDHEFEPGELVQIKSPAYNNTWITCTILRKGEIANTYNVYFGKGAIGHRDMHNIDSWGLRRFTYTPGTKVEVFMKKGYNAGLWVQGIVTRKVTDKRDMYDVLVDDTPLEYNMTSVPYILLRKSEAEEKRLHEKWLEQAQLKVAEDRAKELAKRYEERWDAEHTFQDGECAQVRAKGETSDEWTSVTILDRGSTKDRYNIKWERIIGYPKRRQVLYIKDVKRENLRKDPKCQEAQLREAEEARRRLEEQEAKRQAAVKARARAEEEAQRKQERQQAAKEAEVRARHELEEQEAKVAQQQAEELAESTAEFTAKQQVMSLRDSMVAPPAPDGEVDRVSEEELAQIVADAQEAMRAAEDRELEKRQEKEPKSIWKMDAETAKAQSEWDAMIAAEDERLEQEAEASEQATSEPAEQEATGTPADAGEWRPDSWPGETHEEFEGGEADGVQQQPDEFARGASGVVIEQQAIGQAEAKDEEQPRDEAQEMAE